MDWSNGHEGYEIGDHDRHGRWFVRRRRVCSNRFAQPSSVVRTGFEYGSYYQTSAQQPASPSNAPVAEPAPTVAAPAAGCTTGCADASPTCAAPAGCSTCSNGGCSDCKECALECEDRCEPWRLFGCYNENNCRGINIRGWVNAGMMDNPDNPASRFNGPTTFYDRDAEAQLSQLYLIAEKALDPEKCGWQIGGRIDVLYGTDYRFNISRGLTANNDFTAKANSSRFYGLDIPQAYVELGKENTSIKLGHFYTIIGYEVVTAPDNFFMTHAYTMQYGEPFTHTGTLVTQKINDQLSLLGGVTTGWDNFNDVYNQLSFIGGATFTASDGNSKLAYAFSVGEEETTFATVTPTETRYIQSVVYSRKLTDRLDYVFQSDYGSQQNAGGAAGTTAEWYGVNQYLFYRINCCWSAGLRGEWFRDDAGFRVAPAGDYAALGPAVNNNPAGAGGFAGDFYEVAAGVNWKPQSRPNLTVRGETRYDWYNGTAGVNGQPFNDGAKNEQFLYGLDFIYAY
ncbi:MAG: porin [Pirellulales bacterium]